MAPCKFSCFRCLRKTSLKVCFLNRGVAGLIPPWSAPAPAPLNNASTNSSSKFAICANESSSRSAHLQPLPHNRSFRAHKQYAKRTPAARLEISKLQVAKSSSEKHTHLIGTFSANVTGCRFLCRSLAGCSWRHRLLASCSSGRLRDVKNFRSKL